MISTLHTFEYALLIVLVALKVTEQIDLSWWWVTAPIWLLPVVQFAYGFVTVLPKAFRSSYHEARRRRREGPFNP